jgi:hypothetical protein
VTGHRGILSTEFLNSRESADGAGGGAAHEVNSSPGTAVSLTAIAQPGEEAWQDPSRARGHRRFKKLLAEAMLNNAAFKDIIGKNG